MTKEEIEAMIELLHLEVKYLQNTRDGLTKFIELKIMSISNLVKKLEET